MIGNRQDVIKWLLSQDDSTLFTIEEYVEKRGLKANAYCWTLISKIATKLNSTKIEVYREYIKDKGIYRVITMSKDAVNTFIKVWEERGLGWLCETSETNIEGLVDVIAYYGTSSYNKKQMASFIDFVVEEAKGLGIETLDDIECRALLNEWGN